MYIAMDRKPENGCEIRTSCCGRSKILCRLHIVKGADDGSDDEETEDELPRGTRDALELMAPWHGTMNRLCGQLFRLCDYSEALLRKGLSFHRCD